MTKTSTKTLLTLIIEIVEIKLAMQLETLSEGIENRQLAQALDSSNPRELIESIREPMAKIRWSHHVIMETRRAWMKAMNPQQQSTCYQFLA